MRVRVAVFPVVLAAGLLGAGQASADPQTGGVNCNYTMTGPHVVDVSGTPMVAAVLTPAGCAGSAEPYTSQVCLTTPGLVGRCAELPGYTEARVYLSPYVPGKTYTATGRGCSSAQWSAPACTSVGPRSATL